MTTNTRPSLDSFVTKSSRPSLDSFSQHPPLPPPPQPKSFLDNIGEGIQNIFPGKQVGQAIGTLGGLAAEKVKGVFGGQDNSKFYDTSAPSPLQVAGDIGAGALTIAAPERAGAQWGAGVQIANDAVTGAGIGGFGAIASGQKPGEVAKSAALGGLLGGGLSALGEGVGALKSARAANKATKEADTVTEMISPKPTVKEAKIAQSQGRLVQGKEPTLFKAGTEDKIIPSKKTLSASETIRKNIPNASKMKPTELYAAVDKNITDTATKLRPQMEATPIKPETIQKINSDWESIKKGQMAEAPATEEANVAKRQAKFESLLKKSGSNSHADLWDTRIAYDESIPDAVKKANPTTSSESQLLQKDEWLQNRKILNDAIDTTGKPEFKQMSDMYEARNGLLSKAKVNDAQMSKINQFLKDNPKVAAGLGGATIYEIAKHSGIPLP